MPERVVVLVVGQIPPPIHGQAVMIEKLLEGRYEHLELVHVPMSFSQDMSEMGRFRLGKVAHLLSVIAKVVGVRLRRRPVLLYYPPSGADRMPVYRDIAILFSTRWLFPKTALHFLAGGVSDFHPRMSRIGRQLFERAYFDADCAIRLSHLTPPDGERLHAKRDVVIPLGIEDLYPAEALPDEREEGPPRILFVGTVMEEKGIDVLLDACRILKERDVDFELQLMGRPLTPAYEEHVKARVATELPGVGKVLGVRRDKAKWQTFARANLLCLPSHYRHEANPVVVLEAMQFALPVVGSAWRGIPALVEDEASGFLVPPRDPEKLADRLQQLLVSPELRAELGDRGRRIYLERYTVERWRERMEQALLAAATAV